MATSSGSFLFAVVILGVVASLNGMMMESPWGNWSVSSPQNCPNHDTETHLCSEMKVVYGYCITISCCGDGSPGIAPHPELMDSAEEIEDETEDSNCDRLCVTVRNCSVNKCYTDCCDGYQRDMYGRCQNKTNDMECMNGGTKMRLSDGFVFCACRLGFSGRTCDKLWCECENNGTCVLKDGDPICECPKGTYGRHCEKYECDLTCNGHGTCVSDGLRKVCNCTAPYVGEECQTKFDQPDECPSVPSHYPGYDCYTYCYRNEHCGEKEVCCQDGCSRYCRQPREHTCFKDGRMFALGEEYRPNPCEFCTCTEGGEMMCAVTACARIMCEDGAKLIKEPGACCPVCSNPPKPKPPVVSCPQFHVTIDLPPTSGEVKMTVNNTRITGVCDGMGRPYYKVAFNPQYLEHCKCSESRMHIQTVEAISTDSSGAESRCKLGVYIRDVTPPRPLSCPEDVYMFEGSEAYWKEPEFVDNVGIQSRRINQRIKGLRLRAGNYTVAYSYMDYSGNVGICKFNVGVLKQDTPFNQLPEGFREHTKGKDSPIKIGLIAGPIIGAIGLFALIIAMCLWCRTRRGHTATEAQTRTPHNAGRQYYDNNIYHLPTDVSMKPPPYSLPNNPPAYSKSGDMKDGEYAYLAPPVYSETDAKSDGISNPEYMTIGTKNEV